MEKLEKATRFGASAQRLPFGRFMEVLGPISWRIGSDSWRFGFMEVLELGAPETAPPHWTGTHTHSGAGFREPKRLKSFENYLSIQPQKTMRATWTRNCGVSFPYKQGNAPNARYLSYSLLATGSLLGIRPALLGLWSFEATGSALCADYGFLTFMEVPSMRGTAPLTRRPSFTMD